MSVIPEQNSRRLFGQQWSFFSENRSNGGRQGWSVHTGGLFLGRLIILVPVQLPDKRIVVRQSGGHRIKVFVLIVEKWPSSLLTL